MPLKCPNFSSAVCKQQDVISRLKEEVSATQLIFVISVPNCVVLLKDFIVVFKAKAVGADNGHLP